MADDSMTSQGSMAATTSFQGPTLPQDPMLANPMDPNLQLRNEVIAIEAAMGRMQEQLNAMRELAAASAAAAASATVTAHRSPLPHNFKAPNLESYSGHKGEDLRAWLFQANEQLDLLGVTDDEARIKIAGMALSKNAKTWYLSVRGPTCSDANRVTTWDQFQTALMAHFYPIDPIKQARDRIANLRAPSGQCERLHCNVPAVVHHHH